MQSIAECYKKVSKDCFKFIKSQETPKDKFKNKEKMIRSFLVPISFWIVTKASIKNPYIVGLGGGQGTGKTTISSVFLPTVLYSATRASSVKSICSVGYGLVKDS